MAGNTGEANSISSPELKNAIALDCTVGRRLHAAAGVSNHITQNVASVPLLWILPLTLYLLTFILTFDGTGWYKRAGYAGPFLVLVSGMCFCC